MKLSEDLAWRGLIKDKTFDDIKWLDKRPTFYWGVDCSSDSLTIGNLAPLLLARRFAEAGSSAVLLVGGATSLVGDPGGKDEERELMDRKTIQRNSKAIETQVSKLFSGDLTFKLVDNYTWWTRTLDKDGNVVNEGMEYLNFLREFGKRFSMTELMQREFVTERMGEGGSGISYAEFSYGLVQGYDFFRLSGKEGYKDGEGVVLQIGGSDQWSNMLLGVAMIRKHEERTEEAHALSMPLIVNKATGKKFGKSEAGAIWLDANKTSVYKFYQFWYNVGDEDVIDYLKIFTLLNKADVENLAGEQKQKPSDRPAQKRLAFEVTALVHGEDQAKKQEHIAQVLFGGGDINDLSEAEIATVREEIPSKRIQPGSSTIDVLVESGLATSNSEARRFLQGKAVYVNNKQFDKSHLDSSDFKNGPLMLRRGKTYENSALVELA